MAANSLAATAYAWVPVAAKLLAATDCWPTTSTHLPAGKRCKTCARLDQERLQVVTTEERAAVAELKRVHICEVMNDRQVSIRGNRVAEADALAMKPDGFGQILKITIDGMDQAKFRCPRNLASSAEFEACWRPQLHVVGTIIHGHMECYFLMNADQPKDSNMNATVICRCLDILRDKLGPQFSLPRTLIVAADSTARESKNQHFANFLRVKLLYKCHKYCDVITHTMMGK